MSALGIFVGGQLPTFMVGVLFGALPLLLGVATGVWLMQRREQLAPAKHPQAEHAGQLVRQLFQWTNHFAEEVEEVRGSLNQIRGNLGELAQNDAGAASDKTNLLLSQMAETNERLQRKLDSAEVTLKQQSHEIESYLSQALTDALTGLPNRRAFDDELNRRFDQWRRKGIALSVLMVDVDHFKRFNDTYGHHAGDYVLQGMAQTLQQVMRQYDVVARLGGEEFALILPSTPSRDGAIVAERVRQAIAQAHFEYEGQVLQVTTSCGLSCAGGADDEIVALLKRADQALYAAKGAGRNRAFWHDGARCWPLGEIATAMESSSPVTPSPAAASLNPGGLNGAVTLPPPSALDNACRDLRKRLADVVRS